MFAPIGNFAIVGLSSGRGSRPVRSGLFWALAIVVGLALAACEVEDGKKGSAGAVGATGADGATGSPGTDGDDSFFGDESALTLWWVIFNTPDGCLSSPCGAADFANDAADSCVLQATGAVTDNADVTLVASLYKTDDTAGIPCLVGNTTDGGLKDPVNAEVHLVVQSHGSNLLESDLLEAQLTAFFGGCPPSDCADVQFAVHDPAVATDSAVTFFEAELLDSVGIDSTLADSVVSGGTSSIIRAATGITVMVDTALAAATAKPAVTTETALTVWWVIFNDPSACLTPDECGLGDLDTVAVDACVLHATGQVTDPSGAAVLVATLFETDAAGVGCIAGNTTDGGLKDPMGAEIHLVVRSHGLAAEPGTMARKTQLTDFEATGCTPCADIQFAIHRSGAVAGVNPSTVGVSWFPAADLTPGGFDPNLAGTPVLGGWSTIIRTLDSVVVTLHTSVAD